MSSSWNINSSFLAPSGAQEMGIFVRSFVFLSDESLSRALNFIFLAQVFLRLVLGLSVSGISQLFLSTLLDYFVRTDGALNTSSCVKNRGSTFKWRLILTSYLIRFLLFLLVLNLKTISGYHFRPWNILQT